MGNYTLAVRLLGSGSWDQRVPSLVAGEPLPCRREADRTCLPAFQESEDKCQAHDVKRITLRTLLSRKPKTPSKDKVSKALHRNFWDLPQETNRCNWSDDRSDSPGFL